MDECPQNTSSTASCHDAAEESDALSGSRSMHQGLIVCNKVFCGKKETCNAKSDP